MDFKQRIRQDARRLAGDREASALLECLAENLFDPLLDVQFMGTVCGAPRAVRDRLAAVVGPLKSYVVELRMIEAKPLVRDTNLSIAEIGKKIGY
ncbi:MAG: helix-turn-helix transcriptional regulator, partial [bacterium]|nr:helix-turn-helix transcriptional regulator [bacterium]